VLAFITGIPPSPLTMLVQLGRKMQRAKPVLSGKMFIETMLGYMGLALL